MRRAPSVALMVLAGCGRLGFSDEGHADGRAPDAADAATLGPFSTPEPLTELNDPNEQDDDPSLTADLLEIFFDSGRQPGIDGDVFTARRASTSEPFGEVSIVAELSSASDDTSPDVTPDGLTMYFASTRGASLGRDLWVSTRPDRDSPWSAPVHVVELSSPSTEASAVETADGLNLYIGSGRLGTSDILVATRAARGQPWDTPEPVAGLADPTVDESQLWINADATVIYFTSTRGGDVDIWFAERADPADPFGEPERVGGINGLGEESDPWLSPDLRTIVFTSFRSGAGDLYIATR